MKNSTQIKKLLLTTAISLSALFCASTTLATEITDNPENLQRTVRMSHTVENNTPYKLTVVRHNHHAYVGKWSTGSWNGQHFIAHDLKPGASIKIEGFYIGARTVDIVVRTCVKGTGDCSINSYAGSFCQAKLKTSFLRRGFDNQNHSYGNGLKCSFSGKDERHSKFIVTTH